MKLHSTRRTWILNASLTAFLTQLPLLAAQQDIATFKSVDSVKPWTSVNDGVMGGVSKGGFKRTEQGTLIFSGDLSLENNGGFASIRTEDRKFDLTGMSAIIVKARGDGRTYWVDLRTSGQMGASSYRAYLATTAGEWSETRIPLADFKLQAFGRALPVKALNQADVASIGFTLADKKEGAFSLEIESVKASDEQASPVVNNGIIHVTDQVLIPATPEATPSSPAKLTELKLIELAIERGVPLFNKGETAACAALYEITCEALQAMDKLCDQSRKEIADALRSARAESSPRQQAWILREGLDLVRARLQNQKGES